MKDLLLFDVDGTITESTLPVSSEMTQLLISIKMTGNYDMYLVSGGEYEKLINQIGKKNEYIFEYICSENGLATYKDSKLIFEKNIKDILTEHTIQTIINCILKYIANLELPFKRGTFIEFRKSMMYIIPIGSN